MTSRPEGAATSSARRTYIDWARGLAVLIMIEAHVLDAWTLRSERSTVWFGYLNVLGGFAAPLFLFLAGLALILAAERALGRSGDRAAAGRSLMRRGLEIFALAFLFRAQAFIVSPGNPLVSLLRVDILNIMGPSMVGAALLWTLAPGARSAAALCAGFATLLAMVTPLIRTASWLGSLPPALQWYISPTGNHSTFTLFPWSGFVFAGAAFGALLAMVDRRVEGTALGRLALVGGLLAGGPVRYASTLPSIYVASSFWTTSPTYFGMRVGMLMLTLAGLFAMTPIASKAPALFGMLARFGSHSLFVYWIHVELVYGYATALVHHRLPLWVNALTYVLFVGAMYWSLALRDRVVGWWQTRPTRDPRQRPSGHELYPGVGGWERHLAENH